MGSPAAGWGISAHEKETKTVRAALLSCLCVSLVGGVGCEEQPRGKHTDMKDISRSEFRADALEAHTSFLSDDLLQGRPTGSTEERIAARYVATQLRLVGVTDVVTQRVPLRESTVNVKESFMKVGGSASDVLQYAADYVFLGRPGDEHHTLQAPVEFARFGISAADLGWDDYKELDVRDKIVIVLFGVPTNVDWPANRAAYYTSFEYKVSNAIAHGAAGVLIGWTDSIDRMWPWTVYVANSTRLDWLDTDGEPAPASTRNYYLGSLSQQGLHKMLDGANGDDAVVRKYIAGIHPGDVPIGVRANSVELRIVTQHKDLESQNVVARIPGGDPALAQEHIVVTAHIDGQGVSSEPSGDVVRNGAVDNAAGVAVLLEIARAFGKLTQAQSRSVVFVATTGEERGHVGANYFVHNFERGSISAAVNIDEPVVIFRPADIVARGFEHSTLGLIAQSAAKRLDFEVSPDPQPEEAFLIRGDSFEFIKAGIPSLWLMSGFQPVAPSIDGERVLREWRRTRYHQPSDDMNQGLDFTACAEFAELNFSIVLDIANTQSAPRWNRDDFFGQLIQQ